MLFKPKKKRKFTFQLENDYGVNDCPEKKFILKEDEQWGSSSEGNNSCWGDKGSKGSKGSQSKYH
ncbi:hypothetical protein [Metabacillus halosaccharovorans]|uniref:Collagen-like protein n=1 Tax=Metabacillus halosaccharovorans TaxID=930124 RepID=A0ABT3DMD5_9BACI|nr:hypothetical protein [Metabacillus halosaccharovorans]MCV9888038.1 hypothetical protein [Metabacillus halosaccharovorans]